MKISATFVTLAFVLAFSSARSQFAPTEPTPKVPPVALEKGAGVLTPPAAVPFLQAKPENAPAAVPLDATPKATAPDLPATHEPVEPVVPPGLKVMRAIPIDAPPVIDINTLPHTMPADVKMMYSQCKVDSNVVAITFDDGPHPQNTPRLLDMLKERGIKATFFMVGKCVSAYPSVVKRIVAEGHEIGNHTWNHPQLNLMKEVRVIDELQKTHDAIVNACGVVPLLYRPPYGALQLSQRKMVHDKFNYVGALWDVDPMDWRTPRSAAKVHDRVLAQTKPGSIILCHDIHATTVDAMPSTLDELKARGYQFVTVTQLLNLDSQTAARRAAIAAAEAPKVVPPSTSDTANTTAVTTTSTSTTAPPKKTTTGKKKSSGKH